MGPFFVSIVLNQSEKGERARDKAGDNTSASGYEEKKAEAKEPDTYHRGQSCRNQTLAEEPLCPAREEVEQRRVEIRTVENRRPRSFEIRQPAKIAGKEFVEPKTLLARFDGDIRKVNG
jgi:hypothetical protein